MKKDLKKVITVAASTGIIVANVSSAVFADEVEDAEIVVNQSQKDYDAA